MFDIILVALISYLLGSIPFGLLISKAYGIDDLRSSGSGNIGATNAWRVGGKKIGIMTFACDFLKSALPVIMINQHFGELMATFAGLMAVIGHVFPIWLKFKGGKGVATVFGMLFASDLILSSIVAISWLITFKLSKISAMASLVSMAVLIVISVIMLHSYVTLFHALLAVLIVWRHKDNIMRMRAKKESMIH